MFDLPLVSRSNLWDFSFEYWPPFGLDAAKDADL